MRALDHSLRSLPSRSNYPTASTVRESEQMPALTELSEEKTNRSLLFLCQHIAHRSLEGKGHFSSCGAKVIRAVSSNNTLPMNFISMFKTHYVFAFRTPIAIFSEQVNSNPFFWDTKDKKRAASVLKSCQDGAYI